MLKDCGICVYVAKVQPSIKSTTDEGKKYCELWFIIGRGANRGGVLDAFCKCKEGQDGGCKHCGCDVFSRG